MNRNWYDLIAGLGLVPLLHICFMGFMMLLIASGVSSVFGKLGGYIVGLLIEGISLSQFVYLVPMIYRFRQQGRMEVVKGILVGALLTILLSCGCAASFALAANQYEPISTQLFFVMLVLSIVAFILITFYSLKYRSREK